MIRLTREEKHLKILLCASACVYFLVGIAFVIIPDHVLGLANLLSAFSGLGLPDIPMSGYTKLWIDGENQDLMLLSSEGQRRVVGCK